MYARNSTLQQAILSDWIEQQLQMSELCSRKWSLKTNKKGNEKNGLNMSMTVRQIWFLAKTFKKHSGRVKSIISRDK